MSLLYRIQKIYARRAVIRAVKRAFDGVKREDGVTLHEADAKDSYAGPDQEKKARELDLDVRWQEVNEADVEKHYLIFSYLDAKGFRYYLPAYMLWAVRHMATRASNSPQFLIYALNADIHPESRDKNIKLFRSLSFEQRSSVREFLLYIERFCETTESNLATDSLDAAEKYWRCNCCKD